MAFSFKKFKEERTRNKIEILSNLPARLIKKERRLAYKKIYVKPFISLVRFKNRCLFTNRSKSVYRSFKMSRIVFREQALKGFIYGIRKASW